jgi:hypothetical protein
MTDKKEEASIEDRTIASIQKQFRGGEHKLAGLRASEFVYAGGKLNQKLQDKLVGEIPGIERYISAPDRPVEMVGDQGGNPLATQPENTESATGASNQSTDQARKEQDEIDTNLAKGRKNRTKSTAAARSKLGVGDTAGSEAGSEETKLNPEGSAQEDADKQ